MYKFKNGIILYDEKMAKEYLKLGFKLIKEVKNVNEENRVKCEVGEGHRELPKKDK